MEKIYLRDYLTNLPRWLENKNETVVGYADETCVLGGADSLNEEYCRHNNLAVYKTHNFGGTIVNFKGDICVANYQPNFNNFGEVFLVDFKHWLIGKGLNASCEGNDVLIDNKYKVASFMSQYVNGCLYTALHISVNMNLSVIQNVCTKPMNKIPKGLTEFGITGKEIDEYVLNYLS